MFSETSKTDELSARKDQNQKALLTTQDVPRGSVPIPQHLQQRRRQYTPPVDTLLKIDEYDLSASAMPRSVGSDSLFCDSGDDDTSPFNPIKQTVEQPLPMPLGDCQVSSGHLPEGVQRLSGAATAFGSHVQDTPKRSEFNVKLLILLNEAERMQQSMPPRHQRSQASARIEFFKNIGRQQTIDNDVYSECLNAISRERFFVKSFSENDRQAMIDQIMQEISSEFDEYCRTHGLQPKIHDFISRTFDTKNNGLLFYNLVMDIANFKLQLIKAHNNRSAAALQSDRESVRVTRPISLFTTTTTWQGHPHHAQRLRSIPEPVDLPPRSMASIVQEL